MVQWRSIGLVNYDELTRLHEEASDHWHPQENFTLTYFELARHCAEISHFSWYPPSMDDKVCFSLISTTWFCTRSFR